MQKDASTRIGYLGPSGTYSEEAAMLFSQQVADSHRIPFPDIPAVIRAVAEGGIEYGIVPLENSWEGSVNITLDTLAHDVDLFIVREIILPIRHSLFVKDPSAPVETIVSHSQALAQCRRYLASHYPRAVLRAVESTAAAAEMTANGLASAAIAGKRAGELFNLVRLDQEIQDHYCNQTRFVALSRQNRTEGATKMSLVCRIRGDKSGTLYELLSAFAHRGINLTRIESRPARTGLGEYIFFIDLDGNPNHPPVAEALRQVAANSLWLKNLGTY